MTRWRRIVKRVAVALGIGTAVLVLLVAGLIAYSAADKQDTFAVRDAEFADVEWLRRLAAQTEAESRNGGNFGVYAHRLKRGSGTVLGFRAYSPGKLMTIDDETYRKVTVWIASGVPADGIEERFGDDSRVRLVVSEGGSAWPRRDCSRVAIGGTLRVQRGESSVSRDDRR